MSPFRRGPAGGSRRNPRIFFVQARPPYFTPLSQPVRSAPRVVTHLTIIGHSLADRPMAASRIRRLRFHPSTKPLTKGFTPARSVLAPATADLLSCTIDPSHRWLSVSEPPTPTACLHTIYHPFSPVSKTGHGMGAVVVADTHCVGFNLFPEGSLYHRSDSNSFPPSWYHQTVSPSDAEPLP